MTGETDIKSIKVSLKAGWERWVNCLLRLEWSIFHLTHAKRKTPESSTSCYASRAWADHMVSKLRTMFGWSNTPCVQHRFQVTVDRGVTSPFYSIPDHYACFGRMARNLIWGECIPYCTGQQHRCRMAVYCYSIYSPSLPLTPTHPFLHYVISFGWCELVGAGWCLSCLWLFYRFVDSWLDSIGDTQSNPSAVS